MLPTPLQPAIKGLRRESTVGNAAPWRWTLKEDVSQRGVIAKRVFHEDFEIGEGLLPPNGSFYWNAVGYEAPVDG